MRWFWIVSALGLGLFYGCGGDAGHPNQVTRTTGGITGVGTGGRSNTGGSKAEAGAGGDATPGSGAAAGAGGEGGAGEVDPRAPIVEITSPEAVSDPDDGEVLLIANVAVVCRATKSSASGSFAVNPASVKIAMLDARGVQQKELAGASTADADTYAATFAVANLPNGPVSFRCNASDTGATLRTGSDRISTFVDHGPAISDVSPAANDIKALKGAVAFEFTVEPAPLADGDLGAEVGKITLEVLGFQFDVTPAPGRPRVYLASINFGDADTFPQAPTGDIPVVITAANSRLPDPAVRTLGYTFKIDGEGPVIKIDAPTVNQIIGPAKQFVQFTVSDTPSGVDKDSVTVTLNGKPYVYAPPPSAWTEKNGTYTFKFDSTKLDGSIAEATINVNATDTVGNKAEGQSRVVYLDDYPPIVSLDPELVRVMIEPATATAKPKCSSMFDPLGDAVSDLDSIDDAAVFRALAWDITNHAAGQIVDRPSYVDQTSVRLYLQPDGTQPLLVDRDGDGVCDHVNTQDKDGNDLVLLTLNPVPPGGTLPNFLDDRDLEPVVVGGSCDLSTTAPTRLCTDNFSDMTYVVRHTTPGAREPVVFARDPKANDLTCTGNSWEPPGLKGRSGWICLVAVATDKAENEGFSRPMRVCIAGGAVPCKDLPLPTCTQDCTPPLEFQSAKLWYGSVN